MEGRALSPDMVFRDSEEPGCSGGVLPDAASGHDPNTLATKLSRCKLACRQAGRVWRGFCKSRYKFYRSRACRGTSFIGTGKLSRYRMFVRGTGAVSRYKLSRSQKSVTLQDLFYGQVRVSRYKI
jgi:hypothetical protein